MTFGGILPKETNWGEQFGQGLGQGLGGTLAKYFQEKKQLGVNRNTASKIAKSLNLNENESKSLVDIFENFSPDKQLSAIQDYMDLQQFQAPQAGLGVAPEKQSNLQSFSEDQLIQIASGKGRASKMAELEMKRREKAEEKQFEKEKFEKPEKEKIQHLEGISKTIDRLEELTPYVGSQLIPGTKNFDPLAFQGYGLNQEAIAKRAQIDSEVSNILSYLRELDSKGQLPKGIFQELLNRSPKSTDSEAIYKGKLKAFREMLNTTIGGLKGTNKISEKSESNKNRPTLEEIGL